MSMIGLRVGPFEIEEAAQVPSPGDWYRARRTGMTRRQPEEVLVRLLPEDASGPQRAALQAAFDNLRAVEDPRIPAAVALYEGVGGLAIDVPDGASLADVVGARGRGTIALTPATLLDVALELAETLQHAHHRNRYHGHLEPEVVRLTSTGKLFLFGFEDPTLAPSPGWTSPERARGEAYGGAADQWALGAILAGLISGAVPWDDEHTALEGRTAHLVGPIEEQWPALARLIRRMLEPDPANRHPSMHPVRQELLALARKARGTSERLDLGRTMVRRMGRRVASEETTVAARPADTSADTVVTAASGRLPTDEAMNLPNTPPPPVVERVSPGMRDLTPLVDEDLDVVHPDVEPDDVPRLRRQDDVLAEEPTGPSAPPSSLLGPDTFDDDDEDFDDLLQGNVAAALAVSPGEGPTAVPYTDPGGFEELEPLDDVEMLDPIDAEAIDELPTFYPQPDGDSLAPTVIAETHRPEPTEAMSAPIRNDAVTPVPAPEVDEPVAPAPSVPIQRVVPVLIGVMVFLMVLSLAWTLAS